MKGLPHAAATAVRESLFAGIAVANQLGSASLLGSVRAAFIHGLDLALVVSAGIALAGLALALAFLPRRTATAAATSEGRDRPVMEWKGTQPPSRDR
jgi:DHA2 family multidrug resistance protein-like MFS transporter